MCEMSVHIGGNSLSSAIPCVSTTDLPWVHSTSTNGA